MQNFNFWDWFNAITITVGVIIWARIVWKYRPTRKKFDTRYVIYCDKWEIPKLPPTRKLKGL